jgi:hypothetical protein
MAHLHSHCYLSLAGNHMGHELVLQAVGLQNFEDYMAGWGHYTQG